VIALCASRARSEQGLSEINAFCTEKVSRSPSRKQAEAYWRESATLLLYKTNYHQREPWLLLRGAPFPTASTAAAPKFIQSAHLKFIPSLSASYLRNERPRPRALLCESGAAALIKQWLLRWVEIKKGERKARGKIAHRTGTAKDDLGMGKPSLDLITGGALNFSQFFGVLIQSSGNDDPLQKSALYRVLHA
jgi:hypothetical protein